MQDIKGITVAGQKHIHVNEENGSQPFNVVETETHSTLDAEGSLTSLGIELNLPWRVVPDKVHGASVMDATNRVVVDHCYDDRDATATATAVNAHDALYEALKAIVNWVDVGCDPSQTSMNNARAALKLVDSNGKD